jgi:hypothetical protein
MDVRTLTPETLVAAYREEGIESLEDLARRWFDDTARARAALQRSDFSLLRRPPRPEVEGSIVHVPPRLPFVVNGTLYDPKDIARFDGRELHFVIGLEGARAEEILALDDRRELLTLVEAAVVALKLRNVFEREREPPPLKDAWGTDEGGGSAGGVGIQVTVPTPVATVMYSQADYLGAIFSLHPNRAYRDLTSQYMFWPFDDWNDEISSLGACLSTCVYSEHTNHEGSSLLRFPHSGDPDLAKYGWDNRISSVMNFG